MTNPAFGGLTPQPDYCLLPIVNATENTNETSNKMSKTQTRAPRGTQSTESVRRMERLMAYYAWNVENSDDAEFATAFANAAETVAEYTMRRFDADIAGIGEPKRQPHKAKSLFELDDVAVAMGAKRATEQAEFAASEARTVDAAELAPLTDDCAPCAKLAAFATRMGRTAEPCGACR